LAGAKTFSETTNEVTMRLIQQMAPRHVTAWRAAAGVFAMMSCAMAGWGAEGSTTAALKPAPKVIVKVVEHGESSRRPEECRGVIVGPGVNQPDPFPGYAGFVGWESPIRLADGDWLVGFNAGYWHASAPTPLQ
jgi:hypothetical protein